MRQLMVLGLLVAVACSSDRDPNDQPGDGDGGDGGGDTLSSATCDQLYARSNECMTDNGCGGAFDEEEFVNGCDASPLTGRQIAQVIALSCDDIMLDLCQQSASLFTLQCCKQFFTCPGDLKCDPLPDSDGQVGVCITQEDAFPDGAQACEQAGDCDPGFTCIEGATSTKCVQVCAP
ncbi:MAG: hypothetical protein ACAI38_12070 [Myxococcota bacterium]